VDGRSMIRPDETEIRGAWIVREGRVEADHNCQRIEHLVRASLLEVGRDASGWDVLYVDSRDGRYWELTYPESQLHGGGPPLLRHLAAVDARRRYNLP
jgi:hypothetical protein